MVDVASNPLRVQRRKNVLHGFRPRQFVELLVPVLSRELKNESEAQLGLVSDKDLNF